MMKLSKHFLFVAPLLLVGLWVPASLRAEQGAPRVFATPDAAIEALVTAARAHDVDALTALVGAPYAHVFRTGDAATDRAERERFLDFADERIRWEEGPDGTATILVGYADWAFPIPLLKKGDGWVFDGAAGAEEVLNRRIGGNELAAITFAEAVFMAQGLYQGVDHDGDGVLEYAMRLVSSPGSTTASTGTRSPTARPAPSASSSASRARTPSGPGRTRRGWGTPSDC